MTAPRDRAIDLRRPLTNGALRFVARCVKKFEGGIEQGQSGREPIGPSEMAVTRMSLAHTDKHFRLQGHGHPLGAQDGDSRVQHVRRLH